MAVGFSGERQFTWRALFLCIFISLGVLGFGYPTAIIGTTLSQPSFLTYMKLVDAIGQSTPNAESLTGTMSGVYQSGAVLGIILGIWIMNRFGRRMGVVYSSLLGVFGATGAAVLGTSPCSSSFAASLVLELGPFSVWISCVTSTSLQISLVDFAAPVYISELVPPTLRGLSVTLTGVNLMIGQALAS
ncbi:hypothetical protein LTR93_011783 [Exophiala xenobiotica]|nr:hypothetical protein LTR93_011783 [Exophiala xenobiotica]